MSWDAGKILCFLNHPVKYNHKNLIMVPSLIITPDSSSQSSRKSIWMFTDSYMLNHLFWVLIKVKRCQIYMNFTCIPLDNLTINVLPLWSGRKIQFIHKYIWSITTEVLNALLQDVSINFVDAKGWSSSSPFKWENIYWLTSLQIPGGSGVNTAIIGLWIFRQSQSIGLRWA